MAAAACDEVTRLNCDGQFKLFVYLNGGRRERPSEAKMWILASFAWNPAEESVVGRTIGVLQIA
jgi:hypothetical protein